MKAAHTSEKVFRYASTTLISLHDMETALSTITVIAAVNVPLDVVWKKWTTVTEIFEAESSNPVEIQRGGWLAILDNFKKHAEATP